MLFSIISIITFGAAVSQAAPVRVPIAGLVGSSSFTVPATHNPNYERNGTAAMLKAYAKYNLKPTREMPTAFTEPLRRRQDGSVPAVPNGGSEYLVPVTIGGCGPLDLDFDTGSSDLDVTGHEYYTSSSSSTYKALSGYTWSISFGDGSFAGGVVGTDSVTVGGTTVTTPVVELANLAYNNAIEFYASANPPFGVQEVVCTTVNNVQVSFMWNSK